MRKLADATDAIASDLDHMLKPGLLENLGKGE